MNILVAEDDTLISELIRRALLQQNHYVMVVNDGDRAYSLASSEKFDAIILDIILPNKDGLTICDDLRSHHVNTPIMIVSSKTDDRTLVEGLDKGADDYLIKPFSHAVLLARLRAITRRPSTNLKSEIIYGDLKINCVSREVSRGNKIIKLRPKEYDLLEYFMRYPETALPRHLLLEKVWHVRSNSASNRLEVYIRHLRKKIDDDYPKKLIHTVRNIGYKLSSEV